MLVQNQGPNRDDGFELHHDHTVGGVLTRSWRVRAAARLRSHSLDRALMAGADPAASPQLAARAARLTSPRFRSAIADGLERLLAAAQGPPSRRRVIPRRAPVLANESELRELATVLRGSTPLYARGIASVEELLTNGTGPAFTGDRDALARRLRDARAAMDGREQTGRTHRAARRPAPGVPFYRLPDGSWLYGRHDSS